MGKSFGGQGIANNPHSTLQHANTKSTLPRNDIQDWDDPDQPQRHYEDGTVCCQCRAVYHNQHWTLDRAKSDLLIEAGTPHEVLCPGCKKIQERNPEGVVTLKGDYWPQHRTDIVNLVHNEECRALHENPLERVIEIREEGDHLVIETTKEKLAQRIGKAIHSAHKGSIDYKWGENNHLVRIDWERKAA